ncbi:phospholipase/carboxylesterase [Halarchaeum grantii]|uniref:Phospholipase/carboxylesterase n=1 Tax=Halarchaeum grantii TaxID=1193105 RepID=A0A830F6H5_9EURY|nr:dienelactone hydrolase family protein [Halarchaeum grantii]GGL43963.1 phospholipase/carboxylesterase [Halarchaeum grantii]
MSERFLPTTPEDPHRDQPLVTSGAPLPAAEVGVILLHGRGESATSITRIAEEFYRHGVAFLAPQAAKYTWYPHAYEAPVDANEPWLTSGVDAVARAVDTAGDAGLSPETLVVFGFSQGACLAAEFLRRRPRRYGGAFVLAGALPGGDACEVAGSLDGTPVFCGVGENDPEVSVDAVERTGDALAELGADVTLETYPDAPHRITDGEMAAVEARLDDLLEK